LNSNHDPLSAFPQACRAELQDRLHKDERVLAWFEPDLDERLQYAAGLVVLTSGRLLARRHTGEEPNWTSWTLERDWSLNANENAGVGALELVADTGRIALWRHTAGCSVAAAKLAQEFRDWRRRQAGEDVEVRTTICPLCGAAITSDDGQCADCKPAAAPPPTASLLRLVGFTRPRLRAIGLGFGLTLAATAVGLVPPYLTMPLMNDVLKPYADGQTVNWVLAWWCLGGMGLAAVVAWVLDWGRTYVLAWVSERVSSDLRDRTYAHLQQLSVEYFGGKRTGDLMSRIGSDTDRICNFLSLNLIDFVTDLLMIVLTAVILISINPLLALVTLLPFPFITWLAYWVRARLHRSFRRSGVAWGEMVSVLADTIPGIRVVKAFAQENREVLRFRRSNEHVVRTNDRVNLLWSFFGPMVTLLTAAGLLVVWVFACWGIRQQTVNIGVLIAFLAYISRFYTKIESMIRMVPATQRAGASAQRIFEILDRRPSVPEPARPVPLHRPAGRIELCDVRFKYGTREVLHGLNLRIEPGEMIGLVGPSGAGKSTLINLICRFYDVASGAIKVDGTDVRSFAVADYRRHIGIVLQDPFLFYGTVAENIAYGRPGASRQEIVAAARAARAHEFILRLPDGYDSMVGERGQSLSGGERQRISIARALLINPRILILDEATSSVDTETEREIQLALENLIRGRTTIAIAHRLSTLRRADRLVVMEQGRIVEIGNHHELLLKPGSYARLHRAQMEMMAQGQAV